MAFHQKKCVEIEAEKVMQTLTFQYRILGSAHNRYLKQRGFQVNQVWNYLNETAHYALRYNSHWLTKTELQDLTVGTSKADSDNFIICSKTVQAICHKYHDSRKANPTRKARPVLNYRGRFDQGWVPFRPRNEDLKMPEGKGRGEVRYCGRWLSFKAHRPLPPGYKLNQAEFTQNAKGDWLLCLSCDFVSERKALTGLEIGIDLNFSEHKQIALSNGEVFGRNNFAKEKIKKANKIHGKIYRLKFSDSERDLLERKKVLTDKIYCDSSLETDESKSDLLKQLGLIRQELSRIWKMRLRLMPAREKAKLKKKLKCFYGSLGKLEYRYAERRRDFQHKTSRAIVDTYSAVYVGKALDKRFSQTRMAKSFLDLAPSEFRTLVKYKAKGNGYFADCDVTEHGSTFSCSSCLSPSGPRGLEGLKMRVWTCENCSTVHNRDENSAELIKRIGKCELSYDRYEKIIKSSFGMDAAGREPQDAW